MKELSALCIPLFCLKGRKTWGFASSRNFKKRQGLHKADLIEITKHLMVGSGGIVPGTTLSSMSVSKRSRCKIENSVAVLIEDKPSLSLSDLLNPEWTPISDRPLPHEPRSAFSESVA